MEDYKKIAVLEDEFEAGLLDSILSPQAYKMWFFSQLVYPP